MQNRPLRIGFYGLAASELDLFTAVRRRPGAALVLVVDPGPMAIARRLAEIAGVQASSNPWDLPRAKLDWIVTGRLARTPAAPLQRATEAGASVMTVAQAVEKLARLEPAEAAAAAGKPEARGTEKLKEKRETAPEIEETVRAAQPTTEAPADAPLVSREVPAAREAPPSPAAAQARPSVVKSAFLRPAERELQADEVVGWALDGLMSSVRSLWGVAMARANGDTCLVERGIELESARPEIWRWLKATVERGDLKGAGGGPQPKSEELAWAPLKSGSGLVGAVVRGRGGAEPFSSSEKTWLKKVGERVASILSDKASSDLIEAVQDGPSAPAALWAAPVLERAAWAREWMREQFEADGCWLFAAMEGSSQPQLVDESWGSASPPFLLTTVRTAMERTEPQVWLERGECKALVLQPLGPWGVKWTVVLEGVPWRGDGRATLARLKKAAVTVSRLLKNA